MPMGFGIVTAVLLMASVIGVFAAVAKIQSSANGYWTRFTTPHMAPPAAAPHM